MCSAVGAPNNEAWWLIPRGPPLHLLGMGHTCVFALALPETCTASLFFSAFNACDLHLGLILLDLFNLEWHARQVKCRSGLLW